MQVKWEEKKKLRNEQGQKEKEEYREKQREGGIRVGNASEQEQ